MLWNRFSTDTALQIQEHSVTFPGVGRAGSASLRKPGVLALEQEHPVCPQVTFLFAELPECLLQPCFTFPFLIPGLEGWIPSPPSTPDPVLNSAQALHIWYFCFWTTHILIDKRIAFQRLQPIPSSYSQGSGFRNQGWGQTTLILSHFPGAVGVIGAGTTLGMVLP